MIRSLFDAGNQNRTPLQTSDNKKKISFCWNSRALPAGSLVVASKSVEQQSAASTDFKKLVPYEDNVSDDSEAEEKAAEKTPDTNTHVQYCTDSHENTCSLTAILATNVHNDDNVNAPHTETFCRSNQPTETSENKHMPDCSGRLLPSDDNEYRTDNFSEVSSHLLSVPELQSVKKEAASFLTGKTEDGLTTLKNADIGSKTLQTKPAAELDVGSCQVNSVKNNHPSDDRDNVCHSVVGRKRHARRMSRQNHTKHRRHHISVSSELTLYSSDEEVEYVWVERTATMAQQLTGWCCLLLLPFLLPQKYVSFTTCTTVSHYTTHTRTHTFYGSFCLGQPG